MRRGAIKDHVVVFRNEQGQIHSWVGRKHAPVALRPEDAKRYASVEAHRLAMRNNEALRAWGKRGQYAAEEASQWL